MRDKFLGLIDGAMKGNSDDLNSLEEELSKRQEELDLNGYSFIYLLLHDRLDDILNLAIAHPSLQIALNDAIENAVDDFAMQEELLDYFRKQKNDTESAASNKVDSNRENDSSVRALHGSFFSSTANFNGYREDPARDWDLSVSNSSSESFASVSVADDVESFDSCTL